MPSVVRFQDLCSGHGGYEPRPNIEASSSVFVNGRGVHRVGDGWDIHCEIGCHGGIMAGGSPTVFANGKAVARRGDSVNCGSVAFEGSLNVFCDD